VLFAHNDDMAIGAIQAIEEAGLKPGKDITIVSIDGVKGAFQAMMAGKLNVTVECSPLLGPQLMQAVKDLKAGKTLPKRIVTQEGIFPMQVAAQVFPSRKY
jgi:simple sugar transport system substrate-binding protein